MKRSTKTVKPGAKKASLARWMLFLPFLHMGVITFLSSQPGEARDILGFHVELNPQFADFLHLPLYFVLGMLWKLALEPRQVIGSTSTLLAILFATLFGALDEFHQSFVPGRTPSFLDLGSDFLGAGAACLSWPLLRRLFFPREKEASGEQEG